MSSSSDSYTSSVSFLLLLPLSLLSFLFFFNATATTEIYTLSLHDALPIWTARARRWTSCVRGCRRARSASSRSEEHTSELQSLRHLVCRLLLEKKKINVNHVKSNIINLDNNSILARLSVYLSMRTHQ